MTIVLLLCVLGLGAWAYQYWSNRAPPHRFVVTLDEPARSVWLTLGNSEGNETTSMDGGPTEFSGSRDISDSAGSIGIEWQDGSRTDCSIDYITNGEREPHEVVVKDRSCPEIGSHVQG